jgi:hypothetical protein
MTALRVTLMKRYASIGASEYGKHGPWLFWQEEIYSKEHQIKLGKRTFRALRSRPDGQGTNLHCHCNEALIKHEGPPPPSGNTTQYAGM